MKVKEYIEKTNYSNFDIAKMNKKTKNLETVLKINRFTPLKYLSEKILNAEINMVYINEKYEMNDEALFIIEIKEDEE